MAITTKPEVTTLILQDTQVVPENIPSTYPNLQKLFLTNTRLSELPNNFENLDKLEVLHLDRNRFEHFPPVLLKLPRLRVLNLSGNQIDAIPEDVHRLSELSGLLLARNQLQRIPTSIGQMPELLLLDLSDNQITEDGIPLELKQSKKRSIELHLEGNPINVTRELLDRLACRIVGFSPIIEEEAGPPLAPLAPLIEESSQPPSLPSSADQIEDKTDPAIPPQASSSRTCLMIAGAVSVVALAMLLKPYLE